jgi:hypothetical protein
MRDAIAHSPLWRPLMESPNRIVIREPDGQFAVHAEIHEGEGGPLTTGWDDFLSRSAEGRMVALRKAWFSFEARARRHLGSSTDDADEVG